MIKLNSHDVVLPFSADTGGDSIAFAQEFRGCTPPALSKKFANLDQPSAELSCVVMLVRKPR